MVLTQDDLEEFTQVQNRRFRVLRRIGSGGMGSVYEAEDLDLGRRVALKTFHSRSAEELYRLKREFRTMADLSHPNLIALHDLFIEGNTCFFTMDLIESPKDFFAHHVSDAAPDASDSSYGSTVRASLAGMQPTLPAAGAVVEQPGRSRPPAMRCDVEELRSNMRQLVSGLTALHDAGVVHRDVKPSNVLIDGGSGRLVVLDFGLATQADVRVSTEGVVGTILYMSPEQAMGEQSLTPATDWYSVGAMLFEVLTGGPLYAGSAAQILVDKASAGAPPHPRELVPEIPEDLDRLCVALLDPDPAARPTGAEILKRLGVGVSNRPTRAATKPPSMAAPAMIFAGRERELEQLRGALTRVRSGTAAVCLLSGPTGIGKSTLIRQFIQSLSDLTTDAVVLEGRCYAQEHVPFKAVDGLIDNVSVYWSKLDEASAAELLPGRPGLLLRLFPVLERVPAVARAPRVDDVPDPQEMRTRAFGALREFLQRLGDRHRLVVVLDDLQWVDADTLTLLADVMRAPDPPPLLLVLSSRVAEMPELEALVERIKADVVRMQLEPLSEQARLRLARALLGTDDERLAAQVADESGGNPFFLTEIAQYASEHDPDGSGAPSSFDLQRVIGERIAGLSEELRDLLELIVVHGQPLSWNVVVRCVSMDGTALSGAVRDLRARQFLRVAEGPEVSHRFEAYHDRIREAVRRELADDRLRAHHRRLALVFEDTENEEALARHWFGAGDRRKAAVHAERAAQDAQKSLNFDRAAEFYRMALDAGEHTDERRRELTLALAETLENAGRSAEAAAAFEEASRSGTPRERLDLQRRSAVQLLRGGHVERGLETVRVVLAEVGDRLASPWAAMFSVLLRSIWIRMRGLWFRARNESDVSERSLLRLETLGSLSVPLAAVDPVRASDLRVRQTLLALKLGVRRRVARALAIDCIGEAVLGLGGRAMKVSSRARELTTLQEDPWVHGMVKACEAIVLFTSENEFPRAVELFEEAEQLFRDRYHNAAWEADTFQLFTLMGRFYLGDMAQLRRALPKYLAEARRRGDLYVDVTLRTRFNFVYLIDDDVDAARRDLDSAIGIWTRDDDELHLQHFLTFVARVQASIYAGDLEAARAEVDDWLPAFENSMMVHVPLAKMEVLYVRARVALLDAANVRVAEMGKLAGYLGEAERAASALRRMKIPLPGAWAELVRAGVAKLRGETRVAEDSLRKAAARFEELSMPIFRAATCHQLGLLLANEDGARMKLDATAELRRFGVRNPARLAATLTAGWPVPRAS